MRDPSKPADHSAADRADDLAALASMELLDLNWSLADIAAALNRPLSWVEAELNKAAAEAARAGLN